MIEGKIQKHKFFSPLNTLDQIESGEPAVSLF